MSDEHVKEVIQIPGWRDTIVKVLLGVLISNVVWFGTWVQDVATKEWVRENPPKLEKIESFQEHRRVIRRSTEKIEKMEQDHVRLEESMKRLDRSSEELKSAVKDLTKELRSWSR